MNLHEYQMRLFGTEVSLILLEQNKILIQTLFKMMKQLEINLSANLNVDLNQSNLTAQVHQINQFAGIKPIKVSSIVFDLIAFAKFASLPSDSILDPFFNLAIDPLVKLWKIGFSGHQAPSKDQIQAVLPLLNPNQIELDRLNQTVFLRKKQMSIDLGAIAKGYIADLVNIELQKNQIANGLINLGGNIIALGQKSAQKKWRIGLQKPFGSPKESIGFLPVCDQSIVTSGIYERYFKQDHHIYHHLLNAKTGYPQENELLAITVLTERSVNADLYTTQLYGMGLDKAMTFLKQPKNQFLKAIFITRDQRVILSDPSIKLTLTDPSYQLMTIY